jgi:hypothetical protein
MHTEEPRRRRGCPAKENARARGHAAGRAREIPGFAGRAWQAAPGGAFPPKTNPEV